MSFLETSSPAERSCRTCIVSSCCACGKPRCENLLRVLGGDNSLCFSVSRSDSNTGLFSTTVGTISSPAQLQHTTVLDPPFSLFVVTGTVMGDSNPKSRNFKLDGSAVLA